MLSSVFATLLLSVAALAPASLAQPTASASSAGSITCQAKNKAAYVYQGSDYYATGGTLVGFKGPNLSFDGRSGDLTPFKFQTSICTSKALNLTIPDRSGSGFADPNPIKLSIPGKSGKCLTLASTSKANSYLVAKDCATEDTKEAQASQFFLQDYKYQTFVPYGNNGTTQWHFQIYDSPEGNIFANPNPCFSGQTCQTDNGITMRI